MINLVFITESFYNKKFEVGMVEESGIESLNGENRQNSSGTVSSRSIVDLSKKFIEVFGLIASIFLGLNVFIKGVLAILRSAVYGIPLKYFSDENYIATLVVFVIAVVAIALCIFFVKNRNKIVEISILSSVLVIFIQFFVNISVEMTYEIAKKAALNPDNPLKDINFIFIFKFLIFNKFSYAMILVLIIFSSIIELIICAWNKFNIDVIVEIKRVIKFIVYGVGCYLIALLIVGILLSGVIFVYKPLSWDKSFEVIIDGNDQDKIDVVITEYEGKLVVMKGKLESGVDKKSLRIYKYTYNKVDSVNKDENYFSYQVIDRDDQQKFDFITVDEVIFNER